MQCVLPTLVIAIGAGLTIPFINLFFFHTFNIDSARFALIGGATSFLVALSSLIVPFVKKRLLSHFNEHLKTIFFIWGIYYEIYEKNKHTISISMVSFDEGTLIALSILENVLPIYNDLLFHSLICSFFTLLILIHCIVALSSLIVPYFSYDDWSYH